MRIRHHRLRAGIRQLNDGCYQSDFCCKIALDFDRGVPTLLPIRSYCWIDRPGVVNIVLTTVYGHGNLPPGCDAA
ncbi:unnamed protein product, partial [Rotaria magnacalcarata]